MSDHLYPTLIADGSLSTPVTDNRSTLQKEVDQYLQEAAEMHERDVNYFDGQPWLPIHQAHSRQPTS